MSPTIVFQELRPHRGDQATGFEELTRQLVLAEALPNVREIEHRGPGADGGVEVLVRFNDGSSWGWQSKWFDSLGESQVNQLKESFQSAIKNFGPDDKGRLTRFIVALHSTYAELGPLTILMHAGAGRASLPGPRRNQLMRLRAKLRFNYGTRQSSSRDFRSTMAFILEFSLIGSTVTYSRRNGFGSNWMVPSRLLMSATIPKITSMSRLYACSTSCFIANWYERIFIGTLRKPAPFIPSPLT
jgi:hypothetical protein